MRHPMARALPIVLLIPLPLVLWYVVRDKHVWHTRHTIGLALIATGTALWLGARWWLGASFTPRAEARVLVTDGVYRYLRHPTYIGAEVLTSGCFVFMGLYPLLLLAIVRIARQRRRAREEEAVLEAAFGEQYLSYRRRTWL